MPRRLLSHQAIPLMTSLPTSPIDGQVIYYAADATNGIIWQLRYNASSLSPYKWEFVGGSDLMAKNEANLTANSATYADLSPPVRIAVPLAGEYMAQIFTRFASPTVGTPTQDITMIPLGTETAVDNDAIYVPWITTNENGAKYNLISIPRRCTQTVAGGFISFMIKRGGNAWTVSAPRLWITPVR